MMNKRILVGLLHYPVYNKRKEIITTSITNLDIHDIARCAVTYDVKKYYLIHPLPAQKRLVQEVIAYWQQGYGAIYNPDRQEALKKVCVRESLEAVKDELKAEDGVELKIIVTDAQVYPRSISYVQMREIMEADTAQNYLLLFGTGWGMSKEIVEDADYVLEPIYGRGTYNHLSVRSAVAIILDRLLGEKWVEIGC